MRLRKLVTGVGVAVLVFWVGGGAFVLAQEQPPQEPRPVPVVAQFLGLTEEQVDQWMALLEATEEAAQPVKDEMAAVRQQLAELIGSENPDPCEVGGLVLQEKALGDQLRQITEDYVSSFEAMLDEEQMRKLEFIRAAARVQPLIPAFRAVKLVK